jgi:ABC-2 type transport system ATP-binding protein
MIKIENLFKSYGRHNVLKGVNIEVNPGEVYGFIGENGAGKSTTMNILAGLIGFEKGECIINNKKICKKRKGTFEEIGYLPEDPKFYQYMNSWEYLEFVGEMCGDSKRQIKEKSEKMLNMVKLTDSAKRPIGAYSRGMKQRLGIAVAMYNDPKILLLDEPSSALDPQGRRDVIEIIWCLKKEGKTIFLSTHILNDIERVCDRVGILKEGQVVLEEDMNNLMKRYIKPVYDIEFESDLSKEQLDAIRNKEFVEEVVGENRKVSVKIKDVKKDSKDYMNMLSEIGIAIISMNLRKNSLEDIFLNITK